MASSSVKELPLIVIVGPTASGKTALAIEVAKRFGGEVICADSRTIYKGMDIGTAKPTLAEQAVVPHWGIDLVEPGCRFTVSDFKDYALKKISEIRSRGRLPVLVGGTGLYVDSILFDYKFSQKEDPGQRQSLEEMSLGELVSYCIENNINLPKDTQNKRRLIRAIERKDDNPQRLEQPISMSVIVGIATDKRTLRTRIERRAEQILTNGVVEESIALSKKYGWDNEAMTGNIYRLVRPYIDEGVFDIKEASRQFFSADWRLAKRQMTWFRRNPHIVWLSQADAVDYIGVVLAAEQIT